VGHNEAFEIVDVTNQLFNIQNPNQS